MSLPGFTAEASVFRSPRQYRLNPRGTAKLSGSVKGVAPQMQSGETCMDWECLFWCEDHSSYPEACYAACQIPCNPDVPPEMLPPPG